MGNKTQESIIQKNTQYKPSEFKALIEKINFLNKFKSERKFYNNIDINNKELVNFQMNMNIFMESNDFLFQL